MEGHPEHDLAEGGEAADTRGEAEFPQVELEEDHEEVWDHRDERNQHEDLTESHFYY